MVDNLKFICYNILKYLTIIGFVSSIINSGLNLFQNVIPNRAKKVMEYNRKMNGNMLVSTVVTTLGVGSVFAAMNGALAFKAFRRGEIRKDALYAATAAVTAGALVALGLASYNNGMENYKEFILKEKEQKMVGDGWSCERGNKELQCKKTFYDEPVQNIGGYSSFRWEQRYYHIDEKKLEVRSTY
ncbi:MAG: hypothetical protein LLG04_11860 [Parachlamydia sp.]|nr:hypothetical protein [Parachlamydia sp.]